MQGDQLQCVIPVQGTNNLQELNRMREEALLTDVTIVAEDREFECHRAVLAASCPYFKAMFLSGLRECRETQVQVHGVDGKTMDMILHFVYTGICILSKSTASNILKAADLIGLIALRDAAVQYLQKNVDVTNCLQIQKLAYEHSLEKIYQTVKQFSQQHFAEVIQQEQYLSLDVPQVIDYLRDDDINVTREEVVFDAAVKWVRYDMENRSQLIGQILDCVRLPFVKPEYLKLQATVDPLVYGSKECVRQVLEARKYQISGEFSRDLDSGQRKPRRGTSKEVLMIFGAESLIKSLHHELADDVFYYDVTRKRWDTVSMAPGTLNARAYTAASLQYEVYLTGGTQDNKASKDARVFYTYLNKWRSIASLNHARYHHACVTEDGKLYAIGGTNGKRCLDEVERYCPHADQWETLPKLTHAVKCPAATSCKGKIYVFGGFTDSYQITQAVQIHDTATGRWSCTTSSLIDYTCAKAACLESKIYLLGGSSKTVKIYDTSTGSIEIGPSMNQKRDNCSVAVLDNKLYVTGGVSESSGSSLDSVECFCPRRNQWETVSTMPKKIYRHSSVAARIPMYQRDRPKHMISASRNNNCKNTTV